MKKYYFVTIRIMNGEYVYWQYIPLAIPLHSSIDFRAQRIVSKLYGYGKRGDNDTFYFHNGEVAANLHSYRLINEEDYIILKQYIP